MRGKAFVGATLALVALAAIGCSSSSATGAPYAPYDGQGALATAAPAVSEGGQVGGPFPAATAGATYVGDGSGSLPYQTGGVDAPAVPEDRIIKTGSIHIEVASIDDSVAKATDQIHALGGWMAGSDRTSASNGGLASVTYRVPVAQFEDAVGLMRKLGKKIVTEHSDSQSVGGQIVDLQARIDNLKATEKAVQAIMNKATTIQDTLTVQQRLSDIQGQIEQLTAQVTGLSDQSAYSTLTVIFEVPASYATPTPTAEPSSTIVPWSAGEQFNKAAAELAGVGQTGATAGIWALVLILPVALALLLMLILLVAAKRLTDPLRRRWLPVPAVQTAGAGQPSWQTRAPAQSPPPTQPESGQSDPQNPHH
jgi:hypothetical protein